MRSSKKLIVIAVFLCAVLAVSALLDYLLYPYTYSRAEMHHMEATDLDQLIVGTSHGKCGIDPAVLDEALGTVTFNSCQGGEYPIDSYYLIREADRVHDLKRVIYELDPGYWVTGDGENGQYISYLKEFPLSWVKLAYWKDKLLDGDFRSTVFPWYFYRNQITSIRETVATKQSRQYKEYSFENFNSAGQTCEQNGFIRRIPIETQKVAVDPLNLWKTENIQDRNLEWFEKIYEYCRDNGIELVVVITPVPEETLALHAANYTEAYDYLENYMEGRELLFLNYNRMEGGDFGRTLADFADQEGHMYGDNALRFTAQLAKDLEAS